MSTRLKWIPIETRTQRPRQDSLPASFLSPSTTKERNQRGVNRRASQKKSPEMHDINEYQPDQVMNVVYRYYLADGASDPTELVTELPIAPFGVTGATDTINLPFKSIRLRRVRMWCNYRPGENVLANTISLVIKPRTGCRPIQWSDTATYAHTAYISKKFPKSDPFGFWYATQFSETNPEVGFTLSKGSVLELSLDYILSDESAGGQFSHTGAVAARVYTNSLNASFKVLGKDNTYCVPIAM